MIRYYFNIPLGDNQKKLWHSCFPRFDLSGSSSKRPDVHDASWWFHGFDALSKKNKQFNCSSIKLLELFLTAKQLKSVV